VAITTCEELSDIDTLNQKKWSIEAEKLKAEQEKNTEKKKRFEELKKKAMNADFNDDWQSFINYASEALNIKDDSDLNLRLDKAKKKLADKEKENKFQKEINKAKDFIDNGECDLAIKILNKLQKDCPEHTDEIKKLRQKTFDFSSTLTEEKGHKRPIGFQPPNNDSMPDFFKKDSPSKPPKKSPQKNKTNSKPAPPQKSNNTTGIDFFDMDFKTETKTNNNINFNF